MEKSTWVGDWGGRLGGEINLGARVDASGEINLGGRFGVGDLGWRNQPGWAIWGVGDLGGRFVGGRLDIVLELSASPWSTLNMYRLSIPAVVLASLLWVGTAAAQGYAPPPPPPPPGYQPPSAPPPASIGIKRDGFVIGFSLGGGRLTNAGCASCDSLTGPGFEVHLGLMLNPKLALLVEGYGVSHTEQNITLTQTMFLLAAQYWVAPAMWIKGGLGSGRLSAATDRGTPIAESDNGAGFMIAGGYEVYQGEAFAVDLSLRFAAAGHQDGLGTDTFTVTQSAATVGVNWY